MRVIHIVCSGLFIFSCCIVFHCIKSIQRFSTTNWKDHSYKTDLSCYFISSQLFVCLCEVFFSFLMPYSLFLYQSHSVFNTVALYFVIKKSLIFSIVGYFPSIFNLIATILDLLHFHIIFRTFSKFLKIFARILIKAHWSFRITICVILSLPVYEDLFRGCLISLKNFVLIISI